MKKKFITNLALLLLLNLLIKPFYAFGIDRTIQNVVGAQNYGLYFSLLSFSIMLNIFLDMGIENFNRREIARHSHLFSKYLSSMVGLKIILGILFFIIGMITGYILGWRINEFRLLTILLLNQFIASFILFLRSNLGGLHLFKTDSFISVLDRSILIIICSLLLWGKIIDKPFKIEWYIYAQTIAYSTSALITFLIVIKKASVFYLKFDLKYFITILRKSFPYALLTLLMGLYLRMDSVLLERILPDGKIQAGIFAQSFRILEIFSNYGYLFAIILLPLFSRMIKEKKSIESLTRFSFLLIIIPTATFSITCIFYRLEIISLLYNEHIEFSSKVFGFLILSLLGMSTNYIFGSLLTANGSLRQLNVMALIGVSLNLILNLILIPKYNAIGSAIANLSTQAYIVIAQLVLIKKFFKFKINYSLIFRLVIFMFLIFILNSLADLIHINWMIRFISVIFTGLVISVIIGLFSIKYIFNLLHFSNIE
ncbi:MAG: oligosaccharide flippase family protein [Bacteroidales bacterium]|nr:oligosaccharide flippase family protein [Bacteroidales bacterium]